MITTTTKPPRRRRQYDEDMLVQLLAEGRISYRKIAEKVKKTGKEIDFEPLKASDRRIIHLAVSDLSDVTTYTIGDGLLRKVVITPKGSEVEKEHSR